MVQEEKWIKHYCNKHEILLVGEGDFSFAASLATAFGSAVNITATSLDTEETLEWKYPTGAAANLRLLKEKRCTIIHGVDACTMTNHHLLSHRRFDRIVFNFPHAGFPAFEHHTFQIELHRGVVRGFMRSASEMMREKGEVHVTHKTSHPYFRWDIAGVGKEEGFLLLEQANFVITDYPGYQNKRGSGTNSNQSFPVGDCSTYKFVLK
ncbi:methyltransferase small domain protein [Perilla frutescens var. hirtella]|uniref:Methyltransferase small domain protein n=1 Tax=Perilla frutescens var. hirtella TaxID=608512 RepID=A0AAD4P1L8_PERFH|nr:methyltransferase small domain protein [Perilla frutescens var. hirtella]